VKVILTEAVFSGNKSDLIAVSPYWCPTTTLVVPSCKKISVVRAVAMVCSPGSAATFHLNPPVPPPPIVRYTSTRKYCPFREALTDKCGSFSTSIVSFRIVNVGLTLVGMFTKLEIVVLPTSSIFCAVYLSNDGVVFLRLTSKNVAPVP